MTASLFQKTFNRLNRTLPVLRAPKHERVVKCSLWIYEVWIGDPPISAHVDIRAYGWNGACSCEAFRAFALPLIESGKAPDDDLRCDHILAARWHVMQNDVPRLISKNGQLRAAEKRIDK